MKNLTTRMIALALALLLLGAAALAEVRTTGNVWLRAEPNREGEQITSFPENTVLEYLGETVYDERPVAWYKVTKNGFTGWISSMYAELIGEQSIVVSPAATAAPEAPATGASWFLGGASAADGSVELSGYYRAGLMAAATALSLTNFRNEDNSEVPYQYYNDAVTIAGYGDVEYIGVEGEGYTVFGVSVGMAAKEAAALMQAAGLDYVDGGDTLVFEHRAGGNAGYVNAEGHDSCVNLYIENDVVRQIDWSSYTG